MKLKIRDWFKMLPIFDFLKLPNYYHNQSKVAQTAQNCHIWSPWQPFSLHNFHFFGGGNKNIVAIYDPAAAADEKLPREEKMRWLDYLETFLKR